MEAPVTTHKGIRQGVGTQSARTAEFQPGRNVRSVLVGRKLQGDWRQAPQLAQTELELEATETKLKFHLYSTLLQQADIIILWEAAEMQAWMRSSCMISTLQASGIGGWGHWGKAELGRF